MVKTTLTCLVLVQLVVAVVTKSDYYDEQQSPLDVTTASFATSNNAASGGLWKTYKKRLSGLFRQKNKYLQTVSQASTLEGDVVVTKLKDYLNSLPQEDYEARERLEREIKLKLDHRFYNHFYYDKIQDFINEYLHLAYSRKADEYFGYDGYEKRNYKTWKSPDQSDMPVQLIVYQNRAELLKLQVCWQIKNMIFTLVVPSTTVELNSNNAGRLINQEMLEYLLPASKTDTARCYDYQISGKMARKMVGNPTESIQFNLTFLYHHHMEVIGSIKIPSNDIKFSFHTADQFGQQNEPNIAAYILHLREQEIISDFCKELIVSYYQDWCAIPNSFLARKDQ